MVKYYDFAVIIIVVTSPLKVLVFVFVGVRVLFVNRLRSKDYVQEK